VYTENS